MAHRALHKRIKVARSADGVKVRRSQKVAQEEGDSCFVEWWESVP
jgi:hypothetical protein